MEPVKPDPRLRKILDEAAGASVDLCYTCRSCANECPVNAYTNRLHPVKLVRMAHYGLMDELLQSPELWYCLSCNRCSAVCPMTVKPADLIRYLRWEALRQEKIPAVMVHRVRSLHRDFQHVRLHTALACLNGEKPPDPAAEWEALTQKPLLHETDAPVSLDRPSERHAFRRSCADYMETPTRVSACFTCNECSNACPVCFERPVFDPLRLFRLTNLGLYEEVLRSPSLWLCIECQSCTHVCGQKVKGHMAIQRLQQMALQEGYAAPSSVRCWQEAQPDLYSALLDRVDQLLEKQAA